MENLQDTCKVQVMNKINVYISINTPTFVGYQVPIKNVHIRISSM